MLLSPVLFPGATIRPAVAAFATGEVVFIAGFAVRVWALTTLGDYATMTVMTSADQRVVASGPYRLLRHPAYAGAMLNLIGVGLVWGNWIGLAIQTFVMLGAFLYRIRVEESALAGTLGERYRSYAAGHKRLIPLVW